jgi:ribosomal protein S18 acetylase RimI-like enzyme
MSSLIEAPDRRTEGFVALKKALAYCWSVAVAASPEDGPQVMEKWLNSPDKDAAWIMRENLKKNRLEKASPGWTKLWRERLAGLRPAGQLHLRLADVSEAPAVHAIMLDAFEEYRHTEAPSGALSETVEHVTELLASGKEKGLLCFLDHEPVGSVRFHPEDGMYFGRLAVRTQFQRRGVAKAMLHWLEEYARGQGDDRIWCRVRSAVARNVQLYESLGYAKSGEYEVVRKDGGTVHVAVMAKSLR